MTTTPEALADALDKERGGSWIFSSRAAAELRRLAAVETQLAAFIVKHGDPMSIVAELDKLRAEVEALRRGEFICQRCGLRKDAEQSTEVPF